MRLIRILNLDKPVTKKSWLSHMTTLCNVAEEVAEVSIKEVAFGAKEYIAKKGASRYHQKLIYQRKK